MSILQKKKKRPKPSKDDPFICSCNFIPQSEIEKVIKEGLTDINDVYDSTTAGLGACGGSCRPILKKMLQHYLDHGELLKDPKDIEARRKARSKKK